MTTVLIVDDDPHLRRTLAIGLAAYGYEARVAADGRAALHLILEGSPDLVILDLGLPDLDGIDVLRQLRQTSGVPVIVLSARTDSLDKVEALDLGADDYVTKPFGMHELLARVRVALRHADPGPEGIAGTASVHTRCFTLDFADRRAVAQGRPVRLTPTEWRFLEALARAGGRLVTREELLRQVWGPAYGSESNYLRVYANQLRRKLEPDPATPRYLITEPGLGYRLLGEPAPS